MTQTPEVTKVRSTDNILEAGIHKWHTNDASKCDTEEKWSEWPMLAGSSWTERTCEPRDGPLKFLAKCMQGPAICGQP